jgi:hypothetical protein
MIWLSLDAGTKPAISGFLPIGLILKTCSANRPKRNCALDQRTAPPGPMSALGGSGRAARKEEVDP